MPEPLEDYLRRALKQALESAAPQRRSEPPLAAEVIDDEMAAALEGPVSSQPSAPFAATESGIFTPANEGGQVAPEDLQLRFSGNVRSAGVEMETELGDMHRSPAEGAKTLADEMLDLLRTPGGAQKAFLAGEILRRPEDRW